MCYSSTNPDRYCACKFATEINGPNGTCICGGILSDMREDGHCYCHFGNSHSEFECFWTWFGVIIGYTVLAALCLGAMACIAALYVDCKNCKDKQNVEPDATAAETVVATVEQRSCELPGYETNFETNYDTSSPPPYSPPPPTTVKPESVL